VDKQLVEAAASLQGVSDVCNQDMLGCAVKREPMEVDAGFVKEEL